MPKKLYRSRKNRVFGGVAGGLAEYFNIDPILMRVIFVILTLLLSGAGILIYIVCWIVIPEEPFEIAYNIKKESSTEGGPELFETAPPFQPAPQKKSTGRLIVGVLLILLGIIFFLERFVPSFDFEDVLTIALILIGGSLIWNSLSKERGAK